MTLHSTAQSDRSAGALLAMAAGDALGAGYEFGPPLAEDVDVRMAGGGSFGWAPGEWTDDTSMAVAIAEVSGEGLDLRTIEAQDRIAARWIEWAADAADVGVQTRQVLAAAARGTGSVATRVRSAASALHERTGSTAGNGSLMRTAPVALAYLDDGEEQALVEAANAISSLTHADPEAGEACGLWCLAVRHAVREGTFDGLRLAVAGLPADRRNVWTDRLDVAERQPPSSFTHNGWVVEALQGAWSAISRTRVPSEGGGDGSFPADHLRLSLEAAVRGGLDTDTVAAIAGSLLGARWGASAVPSAWRRVLHGWPGLRGRDLVRLGILTGRGGRPDREGWPSDPLFDYSGYESSALARHPDDEHVWLAGVGALDALPADVDAVVSLCRLGAEQAPASGIESANHVEVWLIDKSDPTMNPNLGFVLHDAVDAVEALRAEGRTVLLHCVQAQSRTPTVAALYGVRLTGRTAAETLREVRRVLPRAEPNAAFRAELGRR